MWSWRLDSGADSPTYCKSRAKADATDRERQPLTSPRRPSQLPLNTFTFAFCNVMRTQNIFTLEIKKHLICEQLSEVAACEWPSWWRSARPGNPNSAITNSGIWRGSARYFWMLRPTCSRRLSSRGETGPARTCTRRVGADEARNPAATLRMGQAQCGGEAAKARAHCGGLTHIQPERCFCERIRNSARVRVATEIFARPAASITLLASTLPAPLSWSRMKRIARLSCEGGTAVARRRSAIR